MSRNKNEKVKENVIKGKEEIVSCNKDMSNENEQKKVESRKN